MEKREIGFRSLFPTNQNAAKSVHPTVCTLDDPASGTKAGGGVAFIADCSDPHPDPNRISTFGPQAAVKHLEPIVSGHFVKKRTL